MNTIQINAKFIVVSPPRTGTMSICQMMKDLGFAVKHVPGPSYEAFIQKEEVLADTPMFAPYAIEHALSVSDDVKFIYMLKDPKEWVASMEKVGLNNAFNDMQGQHASGVTLSPHQEIDRSALYAIVNADSWVTDDVEQAHIDHHAMVKGMIPADRYFEYSFSDGWAPLCEFVGKDVPSGDIPHLNKDTMFDAIV